jgi:hypothetical protein
VTPNNLFQLPVRIAPEALLTMKTSLRLSILAVWLGCMASVGSAQNLLINGNFNATSAGAGVITNATVDTTTVPGWSFSSTSSVESAFEILLNTGTDRFLAFNGGNRLPGVMFAFQDFATQTGVNYQVSFTGGHFGPGAGSHIGVRATLFNVVAGETAGSALGSAESVVSTPGGANSIFFHETQTFVFTATGTTSRIVIADISDATNSVDAIVDNISVTAIPEPSAAAAIAGAIMLAFVCSKRCRNKG